MANQQNNLQGANPLLAAQLGAFFVCVHVYMCACVDMCGHVNVCLNINERIACVYE